MLGAIGNFFEGFFGVCNDEVDVATGAVKDLMSGVELP